MVKISVIIPLYNASKFIEKCCISLFSQTLDDIEFIFVNDGSTDNSISLINETLLSFPHRKHNVKIIDRNNNMGVGFTRQQGLDFASGEYVIHCDADDWPEKNMYELIYERGKKDNADIVCCSYFVDSNNESKRVIIPNDYHFKFNLGPIFGALWNKAIKRSFLKDNAINFSKGINWGEDFLVSAKSQILANKISIISIPLYHYCQHTQSITHNISLDKCLELIQLGNNMEYFLSQHNLIDEYTFDLNYLKYQVKSFLLILPNLYSPKTWRKYYPECHNDIMKYESPRYLKIASWMIVHRMTPIASTIFLSRNLLRKILG